MATIFLGGAPGANWTPFLIPIAIIFLMIVLFDYTLRFIKSRIHNKAGQPEPGNDQEIQAHKN